MAQVAVTAVGVDRPGIVAAVSGVLYERGCNLEDTSMTILRGQFAMMLVVDVPAGVEAADLEAAVTERVPGLVVTVRPVDEVDAGPPVGEAWAVSVYGADHPGIVYRVTSELAEREVNVVDLSTRVIGDPARPVYAMLLDVTVPEAVDVDELGAALERLAAEVGVEVTLHPSEADIL
jgi:glycine cleavage system transcriptional repressor